MDALRSFQQALDTGMSIGLNKLDSDYSKQFLEFDDKKRYSYLKIIDGKIFSLAIFGLEEPFNGVDRYSVGYAVSEDFRGRGLSVETVNKGIEDLKKTFRLSKVRRFYLEALIDVTNIHSINVAKKLFLMPGVPSNDSESGTMALLFYRLIVIDNM